MGSNDSLELSEDHPSSLINYDNLKLLTNLLSLKLNENTSHEFLDYLKALKIAKLRLYNNTPINCEKIQATYPLVQFEWSFISDNQVRHYYKGEFSRSSYEGKGIKTFPSPSGTSCGDRYEGDFIHGRYSGNGVYYFHASGDRYEGEWVAGKKEGFGTYFFANGDRFEGIYKSDKRGNRGILIYNNGDRYEGQFHSVYDQKEGIGLMKYHRS